ncbi:MAG: hypothetical protein L6R28_00650 [Planctomycetes bacterium]|nr:hypothetical protein [Planctomycetota bacterium]
MRNPSMALVLLLISIVSTGLAAEDAWPELKVQRAEVFDFAQAPTLAIDGDRVEIAFETAAFCDVAVAVEDGSGRIVRHLAAGVLGENAPPPFERNAKKQRLVGDGKDDFGQYVEGRESHHVRVSLGLAPRFERTLFWSPHKAASLYPEAKSFAATKEGVYVLDPGRIGPGCAPQLKFFDHDGNYVRTIYPFPAAKLPEVKGLKGATLPPDEAALPLKWGIGQLELLTAGGNTINALSEPAEGAGDETALGALAAGDGGGAPIYLAGERLNRLSKDGGSGNLDLTGPVTFFAFENPREPQKPQCYAPTSAALSPDGSRLYLAGYCRQSLWNAWDYLGGVAVLDPRADAAMAIFAGELKPRATSPLNAPTSVACDRDGNVYVSDFLNDCVRVYSPDAKELAAIEVKRPARVDIDRTTGRIYVGSWLVQAEAMLKQGPYPKIADRLTVLAGWKDPKVLASYAIPTRGPAALARMTVDPFAQEGPRLWFANGGGAQVLYGYAGHSESIMTVWQNMNARIFSLPPGGGKCEPLFDFDAAAAKALPRAMPPRHGRQRLYANPADGCVYLGELFFPSAEHVKSFGELVKLDPETGRMDAVPLPFDAEDMGFDARNHAYLRTETHLARFDARTWREVPFDYGEELAGIGYMPVIRGNAMAAVAAAGFKGPASSQLGGMGVSARGDVAAIYFLKGGPGGRRDTQSAGGGAKAYAPKIFPGRDPEWVVHVFNRHGELKCEDALPGIKRPGDIEIDDAGNLWALTRGVRAKDGQPFPDRWTTTLIKARAGKARVLSDTPAPIPLGDAKPDRKPDLVNANAFGGNAWVEGAEWLYGGVGLDGKGPCHCEANCQFALDYFGRTFVPEPRRCGIVVVDAAGNTLLRLGRWGNADDGAPLTAEGGPAKPNALGGDETAIASAKFVAVHTDRRLFIADIGNQRILSVKLQYAKEAKAKLGE